MGSVFFLFATICNFSAWSFCSRCLFNKDARKNLFPQRNFAPRNEKLPRPKCRLKIFFLVRLTLFAGRCLLLWGRRRRQSTGGGAGGPGSSPRGGSPLASRKEKQVCCSNQDDTGIYRWSMIRWNKYLQIGEQYFSVRQLKTYYSSSMVPKLFYVSFTAVLYSGSGS